MWDKESMALRESSPVVPPGRCSDTHDERSDLDSRKTVSKVTTRICFVDIDASSVWAFDKSRSSQINLCLCQASTTRVQLHHTNDRYRLFQKLTLIRHRTIVGEAKVFGRFADHDSDND